MSYYVIQKMTVHPARQQMIQWELETNRRFDTLAEAREYFDDLLVKADRRIAEAYTVTRYKPVKEAGT